MGKRITVVLALLFFAALSSSYAQTTDFFQLAKSGTPEQVQAAIDKGSDVNARNKNGMTPLMFAVLFNTTSNSEVITVLLKAGADAKAKDKLGKTALDYAMKGTNAYQRLTGDYQAPAPAPTPSPASMQNLLKLAGYGTARGIQAAIDQGADVNVRDKDDVTPLMVAAARWGVNLEVIRVLLTAGADVNAQDKAGMTPLMYAASNKQPTNAEVISLLLTAGADVNHQSNDGSTALMYAARKSLTVVTPLLTAGADVNLQSKDGSNALKYATQSENQAVIAALRKAGSEKQRGRDSTRTGAFL